MMRVDVITLFPEYFEIPLATSILGRAATNGLVDFNIWNMRDVTTDVHGTVDDTPYGGGPGMVLKVNVVKSALDLAVEKGPRDAAPFVVLLTPQGKQLEQKISRELVEKPWLIFICGHYEGFDERIRSFVNLELSVGPYVLSGGEPAALVTIDSIVRLISGATGHAGSIEEESFSLTDENGSPLLEYPHYTRPETFENMKVPEVLLSGNHAEIAKWRLEQAKNRTKND